MADGERFVTIYNPVNGLPWECPNDEDSLRYYLDEKGFTEQAPDAASSGNQTKAELTAEATARGIAVPSGATKADIEQLLAEGSAV